MLKVSQTILVYYLLSFILGTFAILDTLTPSQSIRDGETLVSANGFFELGFFSPGKSTKRYLGMWYKNVTDQTVAWVANRETSLADRSGVLNVTDQGKLVLLDGTGRLVWSSSASTAIKYPVVQLLESGNLIVKDGNDSDPANFLWQSFDHPCDNLLPGMKLGRNFKTGIDSFLTSWKSTEDPAPGQFSLWIDPHGFPQLLLRNGSALQYRAGSWNGIGFTGTPTLKPNDPVCDFQFVLNENEVYYMCGAKYLFVSRLWLSQSGIVHRLVRSSQTNGWVSAYHVPIDKCDIYSFCGANAHCKTNSTPVCACLEGFVPKSQESWSRSNWTKGCVRKTPLPCKSGDEFRIYAGLKFPDTSNSWFNTSMRLEECKEKCIQNCSCTAYANSDISKGTGCLLWFGDLMDIREQNDVKQDLYLRMATSEPDHMERSRKVGIIVGSVTLIAMLMVGFLLCIWRKKLKKQGKMKRNFKMNYNNEGGEEDLELWEFDFNSIAVATDHFSNENKLGEGGFGPVYKGILMDGQEIAVKRLSNSSGQGIKEFKNEVTLIAKLQHRNLVKLFGCCIQEDENMLIYEYMPNKSLDFFIFDSIIIGLTWMRYLPDQTRSKLLDWSKRINIISGIARGMLYLHQDSRMRIVHRDLKASNVLLDDNMNPKISDFGMARIFGGDETEANTNKVVGTYSYMSPEYANDELFSMKSDVFSFGVLVLELVTGKKNRGFSHPDDDHNLFGHAWRLWKEERPLELIDDTLGDSCPVPEVLRCVHVGLLCVQQRPEDRPSMSSVVLMLGSESLLPQPKQPGFFTERNLFEVESFSGNHHSCTTNELTLSILEAR